jgi:hypothetical protein
LTTTGTTAKKNETGKYYFGLKCDCRGQFHQHFKRVFFVRKFCAKLFCTSILGLNLFCSKENWRKCAYKMLVKLTAGKVAEGDKFALKKVTNETGQKSAATANCELKFKVSQCKSVMFLLNSLFCGISDVSNLQNLF